MNYTYMVRCKDGTLYTGWTNNIERRMEAHNSGTGAKYTKSRRPVKLVYCEEFPTKEEAMKREYAIKHMKKKEKEKMVSGMERREDERLVRVRPDKRQVEFQKVEFYAFIHFTINTYTGKEWGDGTESPEIFMPDHLDAVQWVTAIKDAGMRGLILTCKHHDGFCLWPSRYTRHSVAASPYKGGKGDIVREVADACQAAGIKFGVYLSPWDRNSELYGRGEEYDDYFVNQLTELLTNYGPVFDVWFDGACGEGAGGMRQCYNWERYYEVIRKLQPDACINVCGPDIRWCGNEAGDTRDAEWSVVPARLRDTEMIADKSQQTDDTDFSFRRRTISSSDADLGSREFLKDEPDLIWYPVEVNTSIRPGWFYHQEEDDKVRSLEELSQIYFHSVGGNGTFLLNIPPNKEGLLAKEDVERLKELGEFLRKAFKRNLVEEAVLAVDSYKEGFEIENVREPGYGKYFSTREGITSCTIGIEFEEETEIHYLILQENIEMSQRIEGFSVWAETDGNLREVYRGKVVGYKHIAQLKGIRTKFLQIKIHDARVCPTVAFLGVF
ncbi:alpha-L-fucosidase [Sporofaciens sp. JLR.KK001]|uniref:alpha-L-fucosidase n=1 Tax=Sporofaciens sp. JLR.KK001 TaxID=3112621 RepID=UPI002FF023B0